MDFYVTKTLPCSINRERRAERDKTILQRSEDCKSERQLKKKVRQSALYILVYICAVILFLSHESQRVKGGDINGLFVVWTI